ncbi:MAG: prenyltransferase [Anaerolineales bacterium]
MFLWAWAQLIGKPGRWTGSKLVQHLGFTAEYFDFRSGLDTRTQRTPFSGGSGTLPAQPELKGKTLVLAIVTMGITNTIGVYFVWLRGWALLPLGLFGIILLVTYTVWWVYHPVLCLIAPGLGFGLLMVMGTHYALTGTYSWVSFLASLVPTFLVSDLLLLNQFPDVEADQSVGRKHYPILLGWKSSALIYGALLLLAYLAIVLGVVLDMFPVISLLALLTAVLGWRAFQGAKRHAENTEALVSSLGLNVVVNVTTPLLLGLSLFLG